MFLLPEHVQCEASTVDSDTIIVPSLAFSKFRFLSYQKCVHSDAQFY